jgi:hypothetical protein
VKDCEKGFFILVKWLDSNPKELVSRILKSLCYNGIRKANTVIYAHHPDHHLAYDGFQFEPIKDAELEIPSPGDVDLHTSPPPHVFKNSDIEKQTAYTYWAEHFPEENPDNIWAKFSPDAVDAALARSQIPNLISNKCYPRNIFDIPSKKPSSSGVMKPKAVDAMLARSQIPNPIPHDIPSKEPSSSGVMKPKDDFIDIEEEEIMLQRKQPISSEPPKKRKSPFSNLRNEQVQEERIRRPDYRAEMNRRMIEPPE